MLKVIGLTIHYLTSLMVQSILEHIEGPEVMQTLEKKKRRYIYVLTYSCSFGSSVMSIMKPIACYTPG